MPKYEVRVRLKSGGYEKLVFEASNVNKAREMAEASTGGKAVGSRQV